MKKDIKRISKLKYLFTIIFGRNREVSYIKDKDNNIIDGNFILTIGRSAVILTDTVNGRREPVIVKSWNRGKKMLKELDIVNMNRKIFKEFIDSDGLTWTYLYSGLTKSESVCLYEDIEKGKVLYSIALK